MYAEMDHDQVAQDVFGKLRRRTKDNLVNAHLATPVPPLLASYGGTNAFIGWQKARNTLHESTIAARVNLWYLTPFALAASILSYVFYSPRMGALVLLFTAAMLLQAGYTFWVKKPTLGPPFQDLPRISSHSFLSQRESNKWATRQRFIKAELEAIRSEPENPIAPAYHYGVFCLRNNAFDCVHISHIVIMMLVRGAYIGRIERFVTDNETSALAGRIHSYMVINRTDGSYHDLASWNDDAWVIDPWYGVCQSIDDIRKTDGGLVTFLQMYPLMDPADKKAEKLTVDKGKLRAYITEHDAEFENLNESFQDEHVLRL
ncbi:MAG: hypothetical protein CMF50_00800 [Legionellales bacterium]|nr:hypothetical protein [Legionellales bacterium]